MRWIYNGLVQVFRQAFKSCYPYPKIIDGEYVYVLRGNMRVGDGVEEYSANAEKGVEVIEDFTNQHISSLSFTSLLILILPCDAIAGT